MKSKQTKSKQPELDTERALQVVGSKLRDAIESIELHGAGEHQSTTGELARLSVAFTGVCAELRQHSKAVVRALEEIPLERIVEYLQGLSEDKQADVMAALTGEKEGASLL